MTANRVVSSFQSELESDLELLRNAGLYRKLRRVSWRDGALMECDGQPLIDFASNDYLGLASDPRIADAAAAFLTRVVPAKGARAGAMGASAARLIVGNHPLHEELEAAFARFKGTEAALLFSSGYTANIGSIPALVGKRDVVYADELNHASLIDACRLSRAEVRVMPHLDIDALRQSFEDDAGKFRRRMVVVDSVFSMEGDYYPLDKLIPLARDHDVWTFVDDAHGTGVLGEQGRGAAEYYGVEGEIDILMGTLGKAIGVTGAMICGSRALIDYLLNRARSFVFTTGTPAAMAAATIEALRIVSEEGWRRERVRSNARYLRDGLTGAGFTPGGQTDGHIIVVVLGDSERTMRMGALIMQQGFLVGSIRPPTVPMGGARLRITVSASHSREQLDNLVAALRTASQLVEAELTK